MGLGKTIQVLGFLLALFGKRGGAIDRQRARDRRRARAPVSPLHDAAVRGGGGAVLIVVPASVVENWEREIAQWGHFATRTLKAGSALLFDYRIKHRGLGNHSTVERPLLYITYARPFWVDVYNFDKKRYENLPPCHEFKSRAERMLERQR